MKKSSLITVALASLVALVGCNKGGDKPKAKYVEEKKIVSTTVSAFFGDELLDYVEVGDDVVYLGSETDPETGERTPVYGPGAAFDVVFWDTQDATTGETEIYSLDSIIGYIGYNTVDDEKTAPDIVGVMEEAELNLNYTKYAWQYPSYIKNEGGQDYLIAPLTVPGYQLEGTYLRADLTEGTIFYRLDVELILYLGVSRDNLVDYFGESAAEAISASGYFQEDTINVFGASISCFDPANL